jgi:trigger factor
MNITRENIDDLNAVLKVNVEKPDYENRVESVLKDYRKKANIKGFRPGMVPIGIVRKMYGKAVQVEEINKAVSENISKYLVDEKLEILGDPIPKTDEHQHIDFDTQEEFTFSFELGLAPQFDVDLSKDDKVPFYQISIDDKMKKDYVENYTRRYGEFRNADITEDKDVIKGKIQAADADCNPVADGMTVEATSLAVNVIKDEEIKKAFIGKAVNDTVCFDIKKAFPNDSEVGGLLRIKKEEAEAISGNFIFTVSEISRFYPAEVGKELFDKVYGEGVVSTEDEFTKKVEEEIAESLARESEFKLMQDIKDLIMKKIEFQLPEDFLKKWLLRVNENATEELIGKEFDNFRKDLKWQLIRNKMARANEIKISEEELQKEAEDITRYQFRQYGLFYATDEQVANYAKETLKREEDAKRIADKIIEDKVLKSMKELVTLENQNVTAEEFNKLFE